VAPPQTSSQRLLLSVWGGATDPSRISRKTSEGAACVQRRLSGSVLRIATLAAACALLTGASGCGGGGGVSSDAVVTAYVEAPLCAAAKQELAKHHGRAGDLRVQAICLPSPHKAKKLSLATLGANARRATEDSTTVAYLEAPDPKASRFVHPILETAEVPWISASSGSSAMSRLLTLIPDADSGSLRESLREELNET
jgi:hypothetical protein